MNRRHSIATVSAATAAPDAPSFRKPRALFPWDFASLIALVSGFLGAGYLLLWRPLLMRWGL